MYDADNPLVKDKNPTVKFDNKNTLPTNRLELVRSDSVTGDVNADGAFNISDVVMLQKWLLAYPDASLKNCKAADISEDSAVDVFDLCIMKRLLITQK